MPLVRVPRRAATAAAVDLYRSVSQDAPGGMARSAAAYVAAGYRRIQVKVGGDPGEDVERVHAVRAAVGADVVHVLRCQRRLDDGAGARVPARTRDLEITLEQPCMSYEECRAVRAALPAPARARRVHRLAAGAAAPRTATASPTA